MNIQSTSAFVFSPASASSTSIRQYSAAARQYSATSPANTADTLNISQAAREALAASSSSAANHDPKVEARLAEIRAKGPANRSKEDRDFLFANDKRLAEITAQGKPPEKLSAEELDYVQKASGFVNTLANLSPAEKALYDKAMTSGNADAAAGIAQIGLIRMGEIAGGANGTTYDPRNTEITAANIESYFSHSIVDSSGHAASKFQALIRFLQNHSAT